MKKFLIGLATSAMIAATVLSPLAEAQAAPYRNDRVVERAVQRQAVRPDQRGHDRARTVIVKKKTTIVRNDQRRWVKGQRFDRRQATNYQVINNPRAYRLSAAPRGYHWVRSGNDAVMIAITSGIIGAVIGNAIR